MYIVIGKSKNAQGEEFVPFDPVTCDDFMVVSAPDGKSHDVIPSIGGKDLFIIQVKTGDRDNASPRRAHTVEIYTKGATDGEVSEPDALHSVYYSDGTASVKPDAPFAL